MRYTFDLFHLIYVIIFKLKNLEKVFTHYKDFFFYRKSLYFITSCGFSIGTSYFFSLSLFSFLFLIMLNYILISYFSFQQSTYIDYFAQKKGNKSKVELTHNINSVCLIVWIFICPLSILVSSFTNYEFSYYILLFLLVFLLYSYIFLKSISKIYNFSKDELIKLGFNSLFFIGSFSFWFLLILTAYFFIFNL